MREQSGVIYRTKDYSIFHRLSGNRDPKTAKRIIKSINEVGYILSPILVNEKYEVIDGQNRLEALKALDMPVDYIIMKGIGINECKAMNIGQANWKTPDYVKSYAETGNENYIRLAHLIDDYKNDFGTELIIHLSSSSETTISSNSRRLVSYGDYKLPKKREIHIREFFETAKEYRFVEFYKAYRMNARAFFPAVKYAYDHPDVNLRRLSNRLFANPKAIPSCTHVEDTLAYFDDTYNFSIPRSKKVFMSADYQKGLYRKRDDEEDVTNEV